MSILSRFFSNTERRRRWRLPWGGRGGSFFTLTTEHYAPAVVSSIIDLLLGGLRGATWALNHGRTQTFANFKVFYKTQIEAIIYRLYCDGVVYVVADEGGLRLTYDEKAADAVIRSADLLAYNRSTQSLLRPILDYLDNILNAANTSIRKLGTLVLLSPAHDENGNGLTPEEARSAETAMAENYGVLDNQNIIKILSHEYKIEKIDVGGSNLSLDSRLQSAVKIICSKLRVPYELVPVAIVGNPNQTGVYQIEAQKRLFQTIRDYLQLISQIANQLGLDVSFDTPDAPQTYERDYEELTGIQLANIAEAERLNYITHDEAVAAYREKILRYDNERK